MNIVYEIQGYDLIINLRIRATPNFGRMVIYKKKKKKKLMRMLIFGRMVVHKERINERKKVIYFVEWSCANERYISMKTLIFGRMVVH